MITNFGEKRGDIIRLPHQLQLGEKYPTIVIAIRFEEKFFVKFFFNGNCYNIALNLYKIYAKFNAKIVRLSLNALKLCKIYA